MEVIWLPSLKYQKVAAQVAKLRLKANDSLQRRPGSRIPVGFEHGVEFSTIVVGICPGLRRAMAKIGCDQITLVNRCRRGNWKVGRVHAVMNRHYVSRSDVVNYSDLNPLKLH